MTEALLSRACAGDPEAFRELTDAYRHELQFHCYRMLGSLRDAEDVLQETLLAAWRGLRQFEGRASLRTWLYRIATTRCLNARRESSRRLRPPPDPPFQPPTPSRLTEPTWLEPYPDVLVEGIADPTPGPEARYELHETIELAFIAVLQQLPARQRAALVLRDALGFRAAEVAAMLNTTEASVKGALQRARATLDKRKPAAGRSRPSPHARELARQFACAFAADDIDGVVALLTDDARLTMPPSPLEYQGSAAVASFLRASANYRAARRFHLLSTRANTQPAFGLYVDDEHEPIALPAGLIVLTLDGDQIIAITRFLDNTLLRHFGLPEILRDRSTSLLSSQAHS